MQNKEQNTNLVISNKFLNSLERVEKLTGKGQVEVIENAMELYLDLLETKELMKKEGTLNDAQSKLILATMILENI